MTSLSNLPDNMSEITDDSRVHLTTFRHLDHLSTQSTSSSSISSPRATPTSVHEDFKTLMMGGDSAVTKSPTKAKKWRTKNPPMIFSGNSNPSLAQKVIDNLVQTNAFPTKNPVTNAVWPKRLNHIKVGRFSDGEVNIQILESVRGKDCYLVQPTCQNRSNGSSVNDNIMELLLMVTTCRRASAKSITAVIPYYGYARQDRKNKSRVPISAADVARLIETAGVDRVIAVDLHCGQIQGFFSPSVPVDNLLGGMCGIEYFGEKFAKSNETTPLCIVSPDAGGVARAKAFQKGLIDHWGMRPKLAMVIKQRAEAGVVAHMDLVGTVSGCDCIIVDDMIDTAGTLCKAAKELMSFGASKVFAFASHGLLNGPAADRIRDSVIQEVVILDTLPLPPHCEKHEKIKQISVAPLIAQTIRRTHVKESVSELFTVGGD